MQPLDKGSAAPRQREDVMRAQPLEEGMLHPTNEGTSVPHLRHGDQMQELLLKEGTVAFLRQQPILEGMVTHLHRDPTASGDKGRE